MRLNINLATQPYEHSRRFYVVWTLGLLVLAVVTAALCYAAFRGWQTAQTTRQHIKAERDKLARLEEQQQRDLAILNRPDNRTVRERSQFLNTLIARKQFSWTQVFASLERLMPGRLHVVSINPQLTEDNQILVNLQVAGDTRDKAIELVRNLEQSHTFRSAQVLSEEVVQGHDKGDSVQFVITAMYVPGQQQAGQAGSPGNSASGSERSGN